MPVLITFFTIIYTMIDDYCKQIISRPKYLSPKPGVKAKLSDSELICLSLSQELLGFASQRDFLRFMKNNFLFLFPDLIHQSQYNRRLRNLGKIIDLLREKVLQDLDVYLSSERVLDTTPLAVCNLKRSFRKQSLFKGIGSVGYCASKDVKYFGFKLVLLIDQKGTPVKFGLVPANTADVKTTKSIIDKTNNKTVFADKGFVSKKLAQELKERQNLSLFTPIRKNKESRKPYPKWFDKYHKKSCRLIETVNNILKDQFNLEKHYCKTFWGLCTKLISKLTAFTLGQFINVQNNLPILQLKNFAFVNCY